MRHSLVVLLVVALAPVVHSQEKARPAEAPPPAPKMSAEGRKFLDGWIGTWNAADMAFTMGGQTMKGSFKLDCQKVSAGWGTLCKGTFNTAGMPPSEGTMLMAWDIATGEAHMFEVMDTGEVHDHSGKWTSDKSVSLLRQGKTLDGKMEKDACTATWPTASELKFDCTGTQGGATVWSLTSTARK